MSDLAVAWGIPNQYALHERDVRWPCACQGRHDINQGYCRVVGYRHSDPFWQCPECLANLALNGIAGARVVRAMREYAEVGR